jgi:hypothetical protein
MAGTTPSLGRNIRQQFNGRQDRTEQEPTSPLRIDQHRIFAKPPKSGPVSEFPF